MPWSPVAFVLMMLLSMSGQTPVVQSETPPPASDPKLIAEGEQLYMRYCATCHGKEREGHLAEHANSLRTASFLHTASYRLVEYAIRYGRPRTAMAAYTQALGGPLNDHEIEAIAMFIRSFDHSKHEPETKIPGNVERGKVVYAARCAQCHGPEGGGATAPSLNDRLFLAVSSPFFLRYAVAEGREGTAMVSFRSVMTPEEMDDVASYVKSWARDWIKPDPVRLEPTDFRSAILNPASAPPNFGSLRDGRYVSVERFKAAMDAKARLVILDVRAASAWAIGHVPGAMPLPYYDLQSKMAELSKDGTWIVAYCSCPVHLSDLAVDALRAQGFKNVATLDEGIAGWVGRGYPLQSGIAPSTSSK